MMNVHIVLTYIYDNTIYLPTYLNCIRLLHYELHDISVTYFHFTALNSRVANAISKILAGS